MAHTSNPEHRKSMLSTIRSIITHRWIAIMMLFVVALALRLYQLDSQSLWLDEGSSWQTIQLDWGTLFVELFSPVSAYPLYHIVLKAWAAVAGESEWALRFPSVLVGAMAVVAMYFAAVEVELGGRDVACNVSPVRRNRKGGVARYAPTGCSSGACSTAPISQQSPNVRGSSGGLYVDKPLTNVRGSSGGLYALVASLLLVASPFALWYAQEVKVYSLFLLVSTLLVWGLLRAIRCETRQAWMTFGVLAIVSIFVHRFALLLLIASYVAILLVRKKPLPLRQTLHWFVVVALSIGTIVGLVFGLGSEGAATGAHIPATPRLAAWLTFVRFSVDRGPGDIAAWWLLPWAIASIWGSVALLTDVLRWIRSKRTSHNETLANGYGAVVMLCLLLVPAGLFLIQLIFTQFYEARYLMQIFPVWLLLLAYPVLRYNMSPKHPINHTGSDMASHASPKQWHPLPLLLPPLLYAGLVASILFVCGSVLWQPKLGLFSGDPVKEQYREVFHILAEQVHPDDVIVLHPAYLKPLYDYYMQRYSTDPAPEPTLFAAFKQGQTEFTRKDWDAARRENFAGHYRSFLVIAPLHARTVDIPNAFYQDEYGLVGIYYQFSREVEKWPCGIWRLNGVHLFCQESPEAYETGEVIQPATRMDAWFGDNMHFLGYTLKATSSAGIGTYRAGGVVPLSLFWDVTEQLDTDYSMFLHLCQDCSLPPVASHDGQPLMGYLPTSTWLPKKPARDDRAIALPPDMSPGRYMLILGMYNPQNPSPEARVPVTANEVLPEQRLVLGEIEVIAPAASSVSP